MKNFIRNLSDRSEFLIVIGLAFGFFIIGSFRALLGAPDKPHISESHLRMLIVYELVMFAALWAFLYLRNWRFSMLGLKPSLRDSLVGVGIVLFIYVVFIVSWLLVLTIVPDLYKHVPRLVVPDLGLLTVVIVCIVNPVFEELFVCAYVIESLKKNHSVNFAINISIVIRLSYHLYQGVLSLFTALPVGIFFAFWYARTGRLWPLLIAHGLIDFIAMLRYVKH